MTLYLNTRNPGIVLITFVFKITQFEKPAKFAMKQKMQAHINDMYLHFCTFTFIFNFLLSSIYRLSVLNKQLCLLHKDYSPRCQ